MRWLVPLIGACAFGGRLVQPAFGEDSQAQSFTINAYAQSVCSLSLPKTTQASNMALGAGSGIQPVINIPSLHDGKSAQLQPASISLTLSMVCNRAHSLHIKTGSGGLRSQTSSGAGAGFANRVDYATHVNWGMVSGELQTSGVSNQATPHLHSPGAYSGNITLQVLIHESGAGHLPLAAGTFTDTLTVTVSPHF